MDVSETWPQSSPPDPAPPAVLADFQALVTASSIPLYRLAARVLGSEANAEDVLQESYLRAFEAWRSGRFEGRAEPDTWLYRIVLRVAVNFLRTRQRADRREAAVELPASTALAALEARAELSELARFLELLPPDQRAVLVLKELEGLSTAQIAEVLECSTGAVEQRLHRARGTLRERCEHE